MPRRGENIHKRKDGRWEGRFIDFYVERKAHYKSVYGASYSEVRNRLKSEKQKDATEKCVLSKKSITDICAEWLENAKIRLKQSSYAKYHSLIYTHIIPYFKCVGAETFTNEGIELFIKNRTIQGNPKKMCGLSAKTIRDLATLLFQIVKYAEKKLYIPRLNHDIALPKLHTEELKILSVIEQSRLVSYIQKNAPDGGLGVLIALYTGIRLGELCALTWEDISFESGMLKITKTVQRIKSFDHDSETKTKIVIDKPKSQKSMREIPIPMFLLTILKSHSVNRRSDNYVLTGCPKLMEPRSYQRKFKQLLKLAGVDNINFHAIRHTFATRAIEVQFDVKSLSEILGHSTVRFTLDRYVHSSNELKRTCMEKLSICF